MVGAFTYVGHATCQCLFIILWAGRVRFTPGTNKGLFPQTACVPSKPLSPYSAQRTLGL
ncbi:type II citrate synthase [Acetobacter orientalis]|uniref:Type II citrate synthase n=1 Tax=Acetobacter orientalis TaxID=146474 RepID=A0A2Z5ZJW3_9PROT|nr:type II citrate synthase [Acetobacter orientalis]